MLANSDHLLILTDDFDAVGAHFSNRWRHARSANHGSPGLERPRRRPQIRIELQASVIVPGGLTSLQEFWNMILSLILLVVVNGLFHAA